MSTGIHLNLAAHLSNIPGPPQIYFETVNANPDNRGDWSKQHEWLAERLNEIQKVFSPILDEIQLPADSKEDAEQSTSIVTEQNAEPRG